MARQPAVADATVIKVLGGYAGLVHRVLSDPQRWLGLDEDPPPSAPVPLKVLDALRDRAFGETTPASPQWDELPLQRRINWWLRRIAISAGLAAAAPRLAGALADRIPLQDALGASAAGLAVCATAREHGVTEADAWVPLLAKVLFDREVSSDSAAIPDEQATEAELTAETPEPEKKGRARQAASTVWSLARAFREVSSMLDERPSGMLLWRALGKLPVVGLPAGWLDERGGIRRASRETARLLRR